MNKPQPKSSGVIYEGGDGSSEQNAVVIKGATTHGVGVTAEYDWLTKKFPGYTTKSQALLRANGKAYDLIEFIATNGKTLKVYFDITDFFGKL